MDAVHADWIAVSGYEANWKDEVAPPPQPRLFSPWTGLSKFCSWITSLLSEPAFDPQPQWIGVCWHYAKCLGERTLPKLASRSPQLLSGLVFVDIS